MRGEYTPDGAFLPENTDCETEGMCRYPEPFEDNHHVYYPKREYSGSLERKYRNLGCHVVEICRCKHDEIHATEQPPDKPSTEVMVDAIERSGERQSRSVRKKIKRHRDRNE